MSGHDCSLRKLSQRRQKGARQRARPVAKRCYAKTKENNTNYASSTKAQIGVKDLRVDDVRNEDEGRHPKPHKRAQKSEELWATDTLVLPEDSRRTTIEIVPGYPYAKLRDRHLAKNTKHKEHQAINTGKLRKTGERHEGTKVI